MRFDIVPLPAQKDTAASSVFDLLKRHPQLCALEVNRWHLDCLKHIFQILNNIFKNHFNAEKGEFYISSVSLLGFIITEGNLQTDFQ